MLPKWEISRFYFWSFKKIPPSSNLFDLLSRAVFVTGRCEMADLMNYRKQRVWSIMFDAINYHVFMTVTAYFFIWELRCLWPLTLISSDFRFFPLLSSSFQRVRVCVSVVTVTYQCHVVVDIRLRFTTFYFAVDRRRIIQLPNRFYRRSRDKHGRQQYDSVVTGSRWTGPILGQH